MSIPTCCANAWLLASASGLSAGTGFSKSDRTHERDRCAES